MIAANHRVLFASVIWVMVIVAITTHSDVAAIGLAPAACLPLAHKTWQRRRPSR